MANPTKLGQAIREYRLQAKLNQEEIAQRVGVSRAWVAGIENGSNQRVAIEVVGRAADLLGISRREALAMGGYSAGEILDILGPSGPDEEPETMAEVVMRLGRLQRRAAELMSQNGTAGKDASTATGS